MESNNQTIETLKELSAVDLKIAQNLARKNVLNKQIKDIRAVLDKQQHKVAKDKARLQERSRTLAKQESHIAAEQEKLKSRRKNLSSLNDFKLQEKANKEVDHASRLLIVQEEKSLEMMAEVEALTSENDAEQDKAEEIETRLAELEDNISAEFTEIDERVGTYEEQKSKLEDKIEQRDLLLYNRISQRYPGSAVVDLRNGACTGCFFGVGPQVLVQVSRGNELVPCGSCGRILALPVESAEEADAEKE